jgi:hypothetical protein
MFGGTPARQKSGSVYFKRLTQKYHCLIEYFEKPFD